MFSYSLAYQESNYYSNCSYLVIKHVSFVSIAIKATEMLIKVEVDVIDQQSNFTKVALNFNYQAQGFEEQAKSSTKVELARFLYEVEEEVLDERTVPHSQVSSLIKDEENLENS